MATNYIAVPDNHTVIHTPFLQFLTLTMHVYIRLSASEHNSIVTQTIRDIISQNAPQEQARTTNGLSKDAKTYVPPPQNSSETNAEKPCETNLANENQPTPTRTPTWVHAYCRNIRTLSKQLKLRCPYLKSMKHNDIRLLHTNVQKIKAITQKLQRLDETKPNSTTNPKPPIRALIRPSPTTRKTKQRLPPPKIRVPMRPSPKKQKTR